MGNKCKGKKNKNNNLRDKKGLRSLPLAFVERFSKMGFKDGRRILHEVYGVFKEKKFDKRWHLLEKLSGPNDLEGHIKILHLHKSSKERIDYYGQIYKKIFNITGMPRNLLDMGCGLNPLSLPFFGLDREQLEKLNYVAIELADEDAKFAQAYFDKIKINGTAFAIDLLDINELKRKTEGNKFDVCFMFKLLDTLETEERGISKHLIGAVNAKWLIVSFSTKTLSGRGRISERRLVWFEKLLEEGGFVAVTTFSIPNEKFYIVRKG